MRQVGRIATTAGGRGTEHATHEGHNAGKMDRFRDAMARVDRRDAEDDPDRRRHDDRGDVEEDAAPPPPEDPIIVR